MSLPDHACETETCTVDWLFDPTGPDDPMWLARVQAEFDAAWSLRHRRCVICGTTTIPHAARGRCVNCHSYWRRHHVERPADIWTKEIAS